MKSEDDAQEAITLYSGIQKTHWIRIIDQRSFFSL